MIPIEGPATAAREAKLGRIIVADAFGLRSRPAQAS
jgi:hypothetical protein